MQHFLYVLLSVILLLNACTSPNKWSSVRQSDEEKGKILLKKSRDLLKIAEYDDAESSIVYLRKRYPMALSVREEAILLLDSINLARADHNLRLLENVSKCDKNRDSLRTHFKQVDMQRKFYARKLIHDKSHK